MTNRKYSGTGILLTIALFLVMTVLPLSHSYTYAAGIPKLENIRVTLFIDSRGTVPTVTLSSLKSMAIGIRKAEGITNWFDAPANHPVRFTMNGYMLKVLDTTDYNAAVYSFARIASIGQPYIFSASIKGKTVYQVRLGGFQSAAEALSAKQKVPADAVPDRNALAASGPLFANAGTYGSENAAVQQQTLLAMHGIISHVVIHPDGAGAVVYSVWLGEATDAQQLDNAKAQAIQAVPGLSLQPIDASMPYLLKRNDASQPSLNNAHYFFNAAEQKVWIHAGDESVKVHERFGRTYRGSIELTQYNGKLAVINQLPFEHYLYSVVSSELGSSWPLEGLKAQAVAARTYALKQGMKYKIAHISDTTFDQAYKGKGQEFVQAVTAVEATRSEVLVDKDGLITPFYYSNGGGVTADAIEAWLTPLAYVKSVPSPDEDAKKNKPLWYRIMLPEGRTAYISSDYAEMTGEKNAAGLPFVQVKGSGINIRSAPYVDNTGNAPITQANEGDRFVRIGQDIESNAFNWIRGPFSAEVMRASINSRAGTEIQGDLQTLDITGRGPSGRVIGMKANGQKIELSNADMFRGAMNGLPSTRFEVEETGKYTILGANGRTRQLPAAAGTLHVKAGSGTNVLSQSEFYVMNADNKVRAATKDPNFRFIGLGSGHGVGMSQYGAKAFAELGYDYQKILKYYYDGVSIVKE